MRGLDEACPYWETDDFEDSVVRGIIAQTERKLYKKFSGKRLHKQMRVGPGDIARLLGRGVYFAPYDRVIDAEGIDLMNDYLPQHATWATKHAKAFAELGEPTYLDLVFAEKLIKLDTGWQCEFRGTPYRSTIMGITDSKGIIAGRANYVVDRQGEIHPAFFVKNVDIGHTRANVKQRGFNEDHNNIYLAAPINYSLDSRFLWNVDAVEGQVRASFGVHQEQIKSLFYARDLPQTATGRKRPILHWVKAHRRRMREGTDVDVKKHLRGVTELEMNGTLFRITNPSKEN